MGMLTFVKTASMTEDSSNLRALAASGRRFKTYSLVGASHYLRSTSSKETETNLTVYCIDMVRAGHL